MSTLDVLIDAFIVGSRGYWYYDFELGSYRFGGGMFFRRGDARKHLKSKLQWMIRDNSILLHYLILVNRDISEP